MILRTRLAGWFRRRTVAPARFDLRQELEQRYPGHPWADFWRVREHFTDQEMAWSAERAFLFLLASSLRPDAQIVEIGSWTGASTCYLAAALKGSEARLFAVDAFAGTATDAREHALYQQHMQAWRVGGTKQIFDRNVAALGLQGRVEAIVADSSSAARNFSRPLGTIDLIFMDADHTESATKRDIEAWLPYLRPGGVMAFHDFTSSSGVPAAVWWAIRQNWFADLVGIHGTLLALTKA